MCVCWDSLWYLAGVVCSLPKAKAIYLPSSWCCHIRAVISNFQPKDELAAFSVDVAQLLVSLVIPTVCSWLHIELWDWVTSSSGQQSHLPDHNSQFRILPVNMFFHTVWSRIRFSPLQQQSKTDSSCVFSCCKAVEGNMWTEVSRSAMESA